MSQAPSRSTPLAAWRVPDPAGGLPIQMILPLTHELIDQIAALHAQARQTCRSVRVDVALPGLRVETSDGEALQDIDFRQCASSGDFKMQVLVGSTNLSLFNTSLSLYALILASDTREGADWAAFLDGYCRQIPLDLDAYLTAFIGCRRKGDIVAAVALLAAANRYQGIGTDDILCAAVEFTETHQWLSAIHREAQLSLAPMADVAAYGVRNRL